jgi:hypothetical protein
MAFNGVFEAPDINVSLFGLFALTQPQAFSSSSDVDDRWVRGFNQEWDTRPNFVRNWDETSNTNVVIKSDNAASRFSYIKPFFVEVEDFASTFGVLGVDRFERVTKQLEAATQKAVEREIWEGEIAQGESLDNPYLRDNLTATVLNSGVALSPKRALAALEFEIGSRSGVGFQGVIHMTRDVATLLASNSNMLRHSEGKEHLETFTGTPIVIGSGYTGNGPIGDANATASITNKWMYATGDVKAYFTESDVVNDTLAQAYDVSGNANDMRIKATRAVSAYFDTSVHLAVRVDLTA